MLEQARREVRTAEFEVTKAQAALDLLTRGPRQEQLDAAAAEVEMARADVELAAYHLDSTRIVAPVSGTVLIRRTSVGAAAHPQADSRTEGLFVLADLSRLEAEVDVQERDLRLLFVGQKCMIQPDASRGERYQGQVSRLMPLADRAKGAVNVRVLIDVPKNDDKLRPNLAVVVSFFAKE
jgi:multidrug resistance efflux pump